MAAHRDHNKLVFYAESKKKLHLLNILLDKLYITGINYMNNAWWKWMNIIPMKSP